MKNRLVILLTAFALLITPLRVVIGESSECKDVAIIFARGSGQNLEHNYLNETSNPITFGRAEPQSFAFFEEINKRTTGLSVERVSLHNFEGRYNQYGYEAVDVVDGFTSKPNHRTDVYNRYYESVADGAEELAWYLEDKLTSCPFQTVILGGYSQGAHVVGDAMFKIKPNFRPRIAYVALFGDPKFNPRTNMIPPTTAPWVRGNASSFQTGVLLARKNYLPDEIALKTSWCDINDPICANYSLANTPVGAIYEQFINKTHQEVYQNRWIPQAANEIAMLLKDRNSALAGKIQAVTWLNKNDKLYQLDLALVIDTSGSMIAMISTIKNNLAGFVSALFNSYWDTRVGIVAYSDFQNVKIPFYYSKKIGDFTYNKEAVKEQINSLKGAYGGDEPEALYSGLMTAMNELSWRPGAQKKILVITDGAAKDPDPGPGHYTKSQVIQRALELDPVSVSAVALPLNYPRYPQPGDIQKMNEEFNSTVLDLISSTNGTITNGQRDYSVKYSLSALDKMQLQPVAEISGANTGYIGEPLALSGGSSYDPDGYITSYSWDCNNDGVFESTGNTLPTFECVYGQPYQGFVVLEATSADSGSAKATLEVNVAEKEDAVPVAPDAPVASYGRSGASVVVSWANSYTEDVMVRIANANDEILGLISNANSFIISPAPESAFTITLSAGNAAGWSEPTVLTIENIPVNESDQSGNIYENDKNVSTPTPTPTATPIMINQTPAASQNITITQPAPLPLTSVAGIENDATNNIQTNSPADNTFVTSEKTGLDTFLIVFGLLILGLGMGAITRKPK